MAVLELSCRAISFCCTASTREILLICWAMTFIRYLVGCQHSTAPYDAIPMLYTVMPTGGAGTTALASINTSHCGTSSSLMETIAFQLAHENGGDRWAGEATSANLLVQVIYFSFYLYAISERGVKAAFTSKLPLWLPLCVMGLDMIVQWWCSASWRCIAT